MHELKSFTMTNKKHHQNSATLGKRISKKKIVKRAHEKSIFQQT